MKDMFLKFVITVTAVLFVIQSHASNYYFSASGNDSYTSTQAQSSATPWQTITKLNSYFASVKPGDSILFKCGETFSGTITIGKSGTASSPIVISSYGVGAQPILSGLAPVSNWVSLGGGIYEGDFPLAAAAVNVVVLNGVAQPMGRYPNYNTTNGGYLNVDSHVAGTQITSSALSTAIDWTGAEVVIRKAHYIIDRATITSNTATIINYSGVSSFQPINNFGFFIQNSIKTLDQAGEWYFNPVTKKLSVFLGASLPAGVNVQGGSLTNLVFANNKNYVVFNGLSFVGANANAIQINNTVGFKILNCSFTFSGMNAINSTSTSNLYIQNSTITNSNNMAINIVGNYSVVSNNIVKSNGLIAGMGQSPNPTYSAISLNGKGNSASNNDVENSGYDAITFSGDSVVIKNNFINYFTSIEDDGGGIYAWGGKDTLVNNYGRQIIGNIVLNGAAAAAGTTGAFLACSNGIYLDDNSSGVTITGNTVSGTPGGIKLHNAQNIVLTSNTLYNNGVQLVSSHDQLIYTAKNITFQNNVVFSKYGTQPLLYIYSIANDISRLGTFSKNNYSNVIDNQFPITVNYKQINLQMWQASYGKDINSTVAVPIPYYTISQTAKRSKFTNSAFNANISGLFSWSANGNFKTIWNNPTTLDNGSLEGYFTSITGSTTNSPSITIPIGSINASNIYTIKFSMIATKSNRRMMVYLRNANSPLNNISETQYATTNTGRTENTFYFTPTASTSSASLVITYEDEDFSVWIDNLGVYQTTATLNSPDNYLFFAYNATAAAKTLGLTGSYLNVKSSPVTGSITLAPFSSIILIKNPDTAATLPPVIYSAPNATKDLTAISPPQRTTNISVYPNPATNYIKFNFNASNTNSLNSDLNSSDLNVKDLDIKLMNTNGDVILSQKVQAVNNSYQINFSTKPLPGCYYILINGSGISQTAKVIIM
jgi:parallel beta-helix repeat protein